MKMEYKDGKIQIGLVPLLEYLTLEDKQDLIEALSCESDVIKHVADQILHGWTENGSHGATCVTASAAPCQGLDYVRRQVALLSSEVAKKEIESLQKALKESQKRYYELLDGQRPRMF